METRRRKLSSKENDGERRTLSFENSTFSNDSDDEEGCGLDEGIEGCSSTGSNCFVPSDNVREQNSDDVSCTPDVKDSSDPHNAVDSHDSHDSQGEKETNAAVAATCFPSDEQIDKSTPLSEKSFPSHAACRLERKYKIRSFSDTYNPLMRYHLNTTTNQFEKKGFQDSAARRRKKYKYHSEIPALSPISGDEKAISEFYDISTGPTAKQRSASDNTSTTSQKSRKISAPVKIQQTTETEKVKGNKRWLRKVAKYATFDEATAKSTKTSKSTFHVPHDYGEEQVETPEEIEDEKCGECNEENVTQRKISTGMLIKKSVTQGLSKFKQLSLGGKGHGRKMEHNYSMISDDDAIVHETSKRVDALRPSEEESNECVYDIQPRLGKIKRSEKVMQRCSSLPDVLDSSSSEGSIEELSNLYLPRRMAICPDLPVEAMKQLRTYLVLTRLKQYCIV